MASRKQPERSESVILAALMSVAGSLFFFGKLESLMRSGILSWHAILQASPILLAVLGMTLWFAESGNPPSGVRSRENGHE